MPQQINPKGCPVPLEIAGQNPTKDPSRWRVVYPFWAELAQLLLKSGQKVVESLKSFYPKAVRARPQAPHEQWSHRPEVMSSHPGQVLEAL
jgi:hypothetical protein